MMHYYVSKTQSDHVGSNLIEIRHHNDASFCFHQWYLRLNFYSDWLAKQFYWEYYDCIQSVMTYRKLEEKKILCYLRNDFTSLNKMSEHVTFLSTQFHDTEKCIVSNVTNHHRINQKTSKWIVILGENIWNLSKFHSFQ